MKRALYVVGVCISMWSANSLAAGVAVIDMQQIFQSSKQVKQINDSLEKQFSGKKQVVEGETKDLQKNIEKYKKDESVMDKKSLDSLKQSIRQQEQKLQQDQSDLQRNLYEAQNKQMSSFLDKIKGIVKNIASNKDLDVVLPKNALLYSKDSLDLTSEVINQLNKEKA